MPVAGRAACEHLIELANDGLALPSLPDFGPELIELLLFSPSGFGADRLASLLGGDPALSSRLVHMARAPYFGDAPAPDTLTAAISRIGLRESLAAAVFFLLADLLPEWRAIGLFSVEQFWIHSWTCATAARMLGQPRFLIQSQPGDLYLGGLLHDTGKLLLAVHAPDAYGECLRIASDRRLALRQAERDCLGIDHATLGARALEAWGLPERILESVACHHWVEEADAPCQELAAVVEFANVLAIEREMGRSGDPERVAAPDTWLCKTPLAPLATELVRDAVVKEIVAALQPRAAALAYAEESALSAVHDAQTQDDSGAPPTDPGKIVRILSAFHATFRA